MTSMHGKTVLITGGTAGIGKATAVGLAKLGARVIVTGRDARRGQLAVNDIKRASGAHDIHLLLADFARQSDVHRLADDVLHRLPFLNVLVNNVGAAYLTRQITADGLEASLAVNHLSPFLLTHLLVELLKRGAPSRVVNVSGGGQRFGRIHFEDLQSERRYSWMRANGQAKLANVVFTYELQRRLLGTGVTVFAVDPGGAPTAYHRLGPGTPFLVHSLVTLMKLMGASEEKAAVPVIRAAVAPEFEGRGGLFLSPHGHPTRSSSQSYNLATARRLWQESERLTGLDSARSALTPA